MAKTLALRAVVLAWLVPDDAYACCYSGVGTPELGTDESVLIVAAVVLALVATVLIFRRARRRQKALREEQEPESDEETTDPGA